MLRGFLLGLGLGILLLCGERMRQRRHLHRLLRDLSPHESIASFSVINQLSMAIATQKRHYEALEQRKKWVHTLLEQAPFSVLLIDGENCLVWWNTSAQHLFNIYPGDYSHPRLLLELVRSYELDQLVEQVRQRGEYDQQDWTFFPINANPARVVKQQSYALRGYGIPLAAGYVGLLVENRQEIAILKQQRDRWTSDVAHELKTPLTSIRLIAETLQSRLDPALVGWADRLVNQSTRLSSLVRDLLDLSQLELDGAGNLLIRPVSLPELIQSAWLNLEPIACKKNLQFTYTGPSQLMVQIDESRMYRVFINLLDNSIKYSPPRERITVVVQVVDTTATGTIPPGTMVQIEVIDAGPGFQSDDLPHIFERFYRADESRTQSLQPPLPYQRSPDSPPKDNKQSTPPVARPGQKLPPSNQTSPHISSSLGSSATQPGGTGLGLAIVQQIIKAHGGYLEAYNHSQTGGAIIRIRLPNDGTVIL